MESNKIFVGTSKGLVIFIKENEDWKIEAIYFRGFPVSMIFIDRRDDNWWVALSHNHWGAKLFRTRDQGLNWEPVKVPTFKTKKPDSSSLKKIWIMQAADPFKNDTYWMGTEPAALFYSNGTDHQLVESLWEHPTRVRDQMWFGTGGDLPFLHSILVDPDNKDIIFVAVSSAGVFRSSDGGKSWQAKNQGLQAAYLPNPNVSSGHDPHMVLQSSAATNVLWQQNHCGIYVSKDKGDSWQLLSNELDHPHYGFCLTIDPDDPNKAWVIPAQSDEERIAPDLKLKVYQTTDTGQTWQSASKGLPTEPTFDIVLRNGFDRKSGLLAFGTNNGNLYISENNGKEWTLASHNLAKILYLKIC